MKTLHSIASLLLLASFFSGCSTDDPADDTAGGAGSGDAGSGAASGAAGSGAKAGTAGTSGKAGAAGKGGASGGNAGAAGKGGASGGQSGAAGQAGAAGGNAGAGGKAGSGQGGAGSGQAGQSQGGAGSAQGGAGQSQGGAGQAQGGAGSPQAGAAGSEQGGAGQSQGGAGSEQGGAGSGQAGQEQGGAGAEQGGAGSGQAGNEPGGAGQSQGGAGSGQAGQGPAGMGQAGAPPSGPTEATQANGNFFPADSVWYQDISQDKAKVSPESGAITKWMVSHSPPAGFGFGHFQVDFSIVAMDVPAGTTKYSFMENDAYSDPDCDTASVPLPSGGILEGTVGAPGSGLGGYECTGFDDYDDCHLLLRSASENRIYEIYRANIPGGQASQFTGGCLAIWDTSKVYDKNGRGQQCTSADAAGYPIAPLLFTAEELKAGVINHAIRFILPNDMIRKEKYVSPATHGTKTTGPMTSIPYGARLRLRADFPVDTLSPAAQVVARALQKYGMFHADGGNIALTAQSDALSTVKYDDLGFDSHSLYAIQATDFEVLEFDTPIDVTFDCKRTAIVEP